MDDYDGILATDSPFRKCMVYLEKTCDLTPVTDVRTEKEESGKCSSSLVDQKPQKKPDHLSGMKQHRVILSGGRALNKEEWEATEIVFRRLVHRHILTRPLPGVWLGQISAMYLRCTQRN